MQWVEGRYAVCGGEGGRGGGYDAAGGGVAVLGRGVSGDGAAEGRGAAEGGGWFVVGWNHGYKVVVYVWQDSETW